MESATSEPPIIGSASRPKSEVVPPATNYAAREVAQARFLQSIARSKIRDATSTFIGMKQVEILRAALEDICRCTIKHHENERGNANFDHESVRLALVGSHMSGYATRASNVDFVLLAPQSNIDIISSNSNFLEMLHRALLDKRMGARLLTKTRVPMIVGCEHPKQDLLRAMAEEERQIREQSRDFELNPYAASHREKLSDEELLRRLSIAVEEGWFENEEDIALILNFKQAVDSEENDNDVDLSVARSSLIMLDDVLLRYHEPQDPQLEIPKSGVGLRWTMYFSQELVLHSTHLFRCYGKCDHRVHDMVVFIKTWAQRRDINDPSHGTLSSYCYCLMTLHYLINAVNPPVLPNLQQQLSIHRGGSRDTPGLCKGHNIRFWRDEAAIEKAVRDGEWSNNRESVGSLLRGFFEYYDNPKARLSDTRFTWGLRVIAIRVPGGILTKEAKGWTVTKTELSPTYYAWETPVETNHRHLLCIEDPFEVNLNVACTVNYPGMCKMKDEFKRAHRIIENLGRFPGSKNWDLFERREHSEPDRPYLFFGKRPGKEHFCRPSNSPERSSEGSSNASTGNNVQLPRSQNASKTQRTLAAINQQCKTRIVPIKEVNSAHDILKAFQDESRTLHLQQQRFKGGDEWPSLPTSFHSKVKVVDKTHSIELGQVAKAEKSTDDMVQDPTDKRGMDVSRDDHSLDQLPAAIPPKAGLSSARRSPSRKDNQENQKNAEPIPHLAPDPELWSPSSKPLLSATNTGAAMADSGLRGGTGAAGSGGPPQESVTEPAGPTFESFARGGGQERWVREGRGQHWPALHGHGWSTRERGHGAWTRGRGMAIGRGRGRGFRGDFGMGRGRGF